ncbi:integral membrane protein [Streptomyces zinciresistens K42]|uniref:Integral membrane protein n=1 Tax=Streptomyces zinciresistens K42 TaxID=700597 RepID=G2GJW6_9ACTN|nr:integral membrane protein [Streptomyces zinciresistens K42]
MVIGAAVLLFIASFLDLYSYAGYNVDANAWDSLGLGMGVYMGGVVGAALVVVNRLVPRPRKVAGLDLGATGVAFAVLVAWIQFWNLVDGPDRADMGAGVVLGFIAALVLAGGAVATPLVPALQAALLPAPGPAAPQPYGAQPPGGYGYPGAQQQSFGGQPPAGQPFGGGQPQAQPPAPAGDFSPFWFAVPVARPLFPEDGSPSPIAELAPGTWYLAVEQRGPALIAQTQDGRRGVLQDTSGIQRG